ncbi:D-Ala-D-Ala carboxypeptidase [Microcella alkaliphila]|uniref:D-Ala-D-Ala carboxypeptidase n=1 Tax=Microcella alkaliphila TaxID=279828 RepID=A0A4Q7TG90_9MICO|nr:M15 family metallopeptidase [Microcella alkaliphila]RZT59496.1 D-Ala-D-Ala carboxypeptidase [Microcella alkaliphila]
MFPARRHRATAVGAAVVLLVVAACASERDVPEVPTVSIPPAPSPTASPTPIPEPSPEPTFDREARSIDDPASIWVVVNKLRPLDPIDFTPPDLVTAPVSATNPATMRAEVADALVALFDAARVEEGIELQSQSAYRSHATQSTIYANGVAANGVEYTDRFSARPGHSEHQTGLAVDIGVPGGECSFQACFGELPAGVWLAENAHRFGFLLRYPDGAQPIVGFDYEPWHFRYIGVELAAEMHEQGVATLEEFFDLQPASDYAD